MTNDWTVVMLDEVFGEQKLVNASEEDIRALITGGSLDEDSQLKSPTKTNNEWRAAGLLFRDEFADHHNDTDPADSSFRNEEESPKDAVEGPYQHLSIHGVAKRIANSSSMRKPSRLHRLLRRIADSNAFHFVYGFLAFPFLLLATVIGLGLAAWVMNGANSPTGSQVSPYNGTESESGKIVVAKDFIRTEIARYPETVEFDFWSPKVRGNRVTLVFTAKNAFGVSEERTFEGTVINGRVTKYQLK